MRRARPEDVALVAGAVRDEDRATITALGYEMTYSLQYSIASGLAWIGFVDGDAVGLWGVIPQSAIGGTAYAWLVLTGAVHRHRRAFLEGYRRQLAHLLELFPVLTSFVDASCPVAVRWARRAGFVLTGPSPAWDDGPSLFYAELRA